MTARAPRALRKRYVDVDVGFGVVVYEAKDPGQAVDEAIARGLSAPYGALLWDSAVDVARLLSARDLRGLRVFEVGCGCGLCGVVAAVRGADVVCSDVDDAVFDAVAAAAADAGVAARVSTRVFDMRGAEPLPDADLVVIADVLYEPELAAAAARRALEAWRRGSVVVVGDPDRAGRVAFLALLRDAGLHVGFTKNTLVLERSR